MLTRPRLAEALRRHGPPMTLGLLVVAVFVLHLTGPLRMGLVDRLEALSYDARLRLTLPGGVDPRIVIVDVDERSLATEGHWPWPRDRLADLVNQLFERYRIAVLAFDMVFAERDAGLDVRRLAQRLPPAQARELARLAPLWDRDRLFAESLRGRPVVLGYYFNTNPDLAAASGALPEPVFPPGSFGDRPAGFIQAAGYGANLPVLQRAARAAGFFSNPTPDPDGVFRRAALLQAYQGAVYETLALAVARVYLGEPLRVVFAQGLGVGRHYHGLEELALGDRRIPVDGDVAALIPYRGPQGSFPYVSAADVLAGTVPPEVRMEGAIVLVGTTAPGLMDLRATPVQNVYPGVEIHANLLAGILDNRFLHRPAYLLGGELVMLLAIGLLLAVALPLLSPALGSLLAAGTLALVVAVNLWVWQGAGFVLPLASPVLLVLGLYALNMSYGYFVEQRRKRQLGGLFGQYVPPELVEEMSRDPRRYSLRGERRTLTVLFSDVRGFTTLSEGLSPEALSELMSAFLTPMTRIIHQHRGTIDKYMGDAIMAFWGAPVQDPDHARHALQAALAMTGALEGLREQFARRGWPPVDIGIGLNTGEMSVGNMGSEFRMAYTVLGDAVNLGSRLEGLTKQYGVRIIASEFTAKRVPDYLFRELDRVRVKGKDRPVVIYEPLGPREAVDGAVRDELELYRHGLQAYRRRAWDEAELQFLNLSRAHPGRRLYTLYLERIQAYRGDPPPEDWDGVHSFATK